MENKLTKISMLLVLMALVILIHVDSFGQVPGPASVPGSPYWGQVYGPSQPQVHIHHHRTDGPARTQHPGNPWIHVPKNPEHAKRLERYRKENQQRKEQQKRHQEQLDELIRENLK